MTAFAIVFLVSAHYSQLHSPLYFMAVSIAISRIVLGMHFLSDVVGSALLGWGLGYVSLTLFTSAPIR